MYLPGAHPDRSSAGFLILDAHLRSVWANTTLADFLGLAQQQLIGLDYRLLFERHFQKIFDPPELLAEQLSKRAVPTEPRDYRIVPGGSRPERWLSCRSVSIKSGPYAGGWIEQFHDISEARRFQFLVEKAEGLFRGGSRCAYPHSGEIADAPAPYFARARDPEDPAPPPAPKAEELCEEEGRPDAPGPPQKSDASPKAALDEPCRVLLENIDMGVLVLDNAHTIILANAVAARLTGNSLHSLQGKKCYSVFTHRDSSCPVCPAAGVPLESPSQIEVSRQVNGEERALLLKAFPLPAGTGYAVTMEDITERKRVEERLREAFAETERSRDWIAGILRSMTDGLIVADGEMRILLMNAAAERLLGIRQHPLFQAALEDCIVDRRLLKRLRELVESGEDGGRFEYGMSGDSAGVRVLAIGASQARDRAGKSQGTVFLLRDVTHERELDRMKNEFISTAAHELRTPLTSIMGFSELLLKRQDLPPEQQSDFLTFIHQKAVNLSRIISDLLDISRIEAGRGLELTREPCDINALIRETVTPYFTCSEKHHLEIALPDQEIVLNIDRGKIIQVLENLLSNAYKYSPRGGRVQVGAVRTRGAFLVSVEDQGIGMNREQLARAFDKFYRGDASNSAVEGTGLGLSITKYIIESHGGRIWLESRKGRGTTAFFTLPMVQGERQLD